MRFGTALAAALVGVLMAVGAASAGSSDGAAGPWADSVVAFTQGTTLSGAPVQPDRSDPASALGPAESPAGDNNPIPTGTFVSLGFGGSLTLGFDNPVCGVGAGFAIEVREITMEPYPAETASVELSADGVTYVAAGTVMRDSFVALPSGLSGARFVRLTDVSDRALFTAYPDADGFDVDGVQALDTTSCVDATTPQAVPTTTACSASYWTGGQILATWRVKPATAFNAIFRVRTFPRKSLLGVLHQRGEGSKALGRQAVLALLTSMTPDAHYRYSASQVKRMVKAALDSHRTRVMAQTAQKLAAARAGRTCPLA